MAQKRGMVLSKIFVSFCPKGDEIQMDGLRLVDPLPAGASCRFSGTCGYSRVVRHGGYDMTVIRKLSGLFQWFSTSLAPVCCLQLMNGKYLSQKEALKFS
jgi:hypothetical protein